SSALSEFTALYVSPQRASPSLPFPSDRAVLLCDNPRAPQVWNRLKQIPFKVFGYAPFFFRRVAEHEPVLVHAHFAPAGLTALPLARWLKVPLVVTVHGYDATVNDADLIRSPYRARGDRRWRASRGTGGHGQPGPAELLLPGSAIPHCCARVDESS